MHRNVFTFDISITHICSGCGPMLNDRLIPITNSYRAVVAVVERGGLTRSSDNPLTSYPKPQTPNPKPQ